jgi:hypothetical protein
MLTDIMNMTKDFFSLFEFALRGTEEIGLSGKAVRKVCGYGHTLKRIT